MISNKRPTTDVKLKEKSNGNNNGHIHGMILNPSELAATDACPTGREYENVTILYG